MRVYELNNEQLLQLKQELLIERLEDGISYGALADADNIISTWEVYDSFDGVEFCAEDFWTNGV